MDSFLNVHFLKACHILIYLIFGPWHSGMIFSFPWSFLLSFLLTDKRIMKPMSFYVASWFCPLLHRAFLFFCQTLFQLSPAWVPESSLHGISLQLPSWVGDTISRILCLPFSCFLPVFCWSASLSNFLKKGTCKGNLQSCQPKNVSILPCVIDSLTDRF